MFVIQCHFPAQLVEDFILSGLVATGRVSVSTRPDPERSGTVEIAPRRRPRLGVVWLARAHPLTKTQAMEPSRETRSSYGPPYPLGRWSSDCLLRAVCNVSGVLVGVMTVVDLVSRWWRDGALALAQGTPRPIILQRRHAS